MILHGEQVPCLPKPDPQSASVRERYRQESDPFEPDWGVFADLSALH
jgi:hypothetical protein